MNQPHQPQWMPQFGMGPPRRMRRRRFSRAEKEFAVGLLNRGWSCRRIARKLGCSAASPIRWRQAMRRNALAAGRAQANIGQPPAPVAVLPGQMPAQAAQQQQPQGAVQNNGNGNNDNCVIV